MERISSSAPSAFPAAAANIAELSQAFPAVIEGNSQSTLTGKA
jgi:hypothetical protein